MNNNKKQYYYNSSQAFFVDVSVKLMNRILVWFRFHIRLRARLIAHLIIQETQQHQTLFRYDVWAQSADTEHTETTKTHTINKRLLFQILQECIVSTT